MHLNRRFGAELIKDFHHYIKEAVQPHEQRKNTLPSCYYEFLLNHGKIFCQRFVTI